MKKIQVFAIAYIIGMFFLVCGYSIGRFKIFPYEMIEPLIQEYQTFAKGDVMEKKTSALEKLLHDWGFSFARLLYTYPELAIKNSTPLHHPALEKRDELPLLFIDKNHREGYRIVIGALNLNEAFWGGLLISPSGEAIHAWEMSSAHMPGGAPQEQLKNLYGVHVFPDGSAIFSTQESGGGLVKIDACSNVVWNLEGHFHHTVSPDDNGYFWSFQGSQKSLDQDMVRISVETGEIVQLIKMADVRKANPYLHIWDMHPLTLDASQLTYKENGNATHGNDIEVLPKELAAEFSEYKPGDLLISYASTNLIFILDPNTLAVKWWRVGLSDMQHDPDWEPGGKISIYSNNSRVDKEFSDIVTVDPKTMQHEVVHHGESVGFYSRMNGRQQLTPFGTRFITSATQGWAYEVDNEGSIVFSFVNNINKGKMQALHMAEAWRYREDYFDTDFWTSCPK
tara:strand:- start:2303 stop:3658 length:1356 start_codon:yes stop_codon:yes gene_type:complete